MIQSEIFFERLQSQFNAELPFIAFRKPNGSTLKAYLQKDSTLYLLSDYRENGFVFAPFISEKNTVLIPTLNSKTIECNLDKSAKTEKSHQNQNSNIEQKNIHIAIVQSAIEAIKSNEFQKVVISRKEIIPLHDDNPIDIFRRLINTYETAFVYCFYHPKVGLWLGATPEILMQIEGNQLTTMALAGTQIFDGTLDVVWKCKEKEEQQLVTDFIVDILQSSVANLQVSKAETVKAGNLLHLKTSIKANLNRKTLNLEQLLKAIHPTPAVCGFPKEKAKEFILKNEKYEREFYTGFLGELNIKDRTSRNSNRHNVENDAYVSIKTMSNLYVNLRCVQLKDNQAFIYVGAGITKDSIAENEWEETVSKARVIKNIL
ncbi:MAG: chorismate-binding protein [Aquaticitalea sp.]